MKIVLILSGGLDSTVLLYHHIAALHQVHAVSVNYGQRHVKELDFARETCKRLRIGLSEIDLTSLGKHFLGNSQTDLTVPVPEGHYEAESMKQTVVPNRNMILLSVALGIAITKRFQGVSYAAHAGDHAIYPDCRPEFVDALNVAAKLADWSKVEIFRPFILYNKSGIVKRGHQLGVNFAKTWSCYKGGEKHCGKCGTCMERREAFQLANILDPTEYEKGLL